MTHEEFLKQQENVSKYNKLAYEKNTLNSDKVLLRGSLKECEENSSKNYSISIYVGRTKLLNNTSINKGLVEALLNEINKRIKDIEEEMEQIQ